eukprot:2430284-Rhodomonas_salina.2
MGKVEALQTGLLALAPDAAQVCHPSPHQVEQEVVQRVIRARRDENRALADQAAVVEENQAQLHTDKGFAGPRRSLEEAKLGAEEMDQGAQLGLVELTEATDLLKRKDISLKIRH